MQSRTHLSEDGQPQRWVGVPDKQAICRSDHGSVMGIFGLGYVRPQYREWLLSTVADLGRAQLAPARPALQMIHTLAQ